MDSFRIHRSRTAVLFRTVLALLLFIAFALVPGIPGGAVDVSVYELDGDVENDVTVPGDDAVDLRSGSSGALATTIVDDPVNSATDVMFQSGGGASTAKDTGDVSDWRWTTKEPADKLDLIDVLAAQYRDPTSGDPFVYIGATRYDGSGASTLGFWFLQDPVALGPGGRFVSVETGGPASHVDGDVLIVADFGGTNLLDIYRWSGTGPVLESTTTLSCLSATTSTPACGVSNAGVIASPWPIVQKGYPSNQIGPQAFVELGVNLESTLGDNIGCYQSIVATSRASDSLTATLNDLALAGVSTCEVSITKNGPTSAAAGETVTYSFGISNDGITALALDSVVDDVLGDITADAIAGGCDSLRGGDSCSFSVDYLVPAARAAGPLTNTVTATYEPPNRRTTATATDSHTAQVYRPAVTVTKTADTDPVNVGETVTYTYTITNSTEDAPTVASPVMSITSVSDDLLGPIDISACPTLATGGSCTLTDTDVPDGSVDPLVNRVEVAASWGSVTRTASASESVDVNRAPVADDDEYTVDEDTVLTVSLPGVLSNDSDPDGDALEVLPVTDGVAGDLTVGTDGSVTFDPAGAFESLAVGESTTVAFEYTASDSGGLTSVATVEITITGVNDPVEANPDSYTVDEDETLTVPAVGVLGNDSDPDAGDTLTVAAFDTASTAGGVVFVASDGALTYTPPPEFAGTDTFTYTVSDGNGSTAIETVTITVNPVNDPPDAVDDSYTTDEDTALVVPAGSGLASNDTDPEGDGLEVQSVDTVGLAGSVSVDPDGSFVYTPQPDFFGTTSFSYTITDGNGGTDTATATVTVNDVNDPPVATDNAYVTDEDITVAGNVVTDGTPDSDPDGGLVPGATVVTDVSNGTLTLSPDGSFTYTPDADFNGSDSFTYTVTDDDGDVSKAATVTIGVSPVNDPPVASDDGYFTEEDTPLLVPAPGVSANDTDPDLDPLSTVLLSDVSNGSLVLNADGSLTYTPNADFVGIDTFSYRSSDPGGLSDTATVTITVSDVNDLPVATDNAYVTGEDSAVSGNVVVDGSPDSDLDGTLLPAATVVSDVSDGTLTLSPDGSFTYTPDADFNGSDSFTYTVTDDDGGVSNLATVTITVDPAPDAPTATDDSYVTNEDTALVIVAPGILTNDVDPDGDTLGVSAVDTSGLEGSLSWAADGSVTFTPTADFTGTTSFDYTISDGNGGTDTAVVTIVVDPENDPPVANDDVSSVAEDTSVDIDVAGNDSDPDGNLDPTTVTVMSGPAFGSTSTAADGTVTYTPDGNYNGPDSFTYRICDSDALCDVAVVTLEVTSEPDGPTANDDVASTDEDTPVTTNVVGNDSDPDGDLDPASLRIVSGPATGTAMVTGSSIEYTPASNDASDVVITYEICDLTARCDTANLSITVNPINDDPIATDDSITVDEDAGPTTVDVLANDSDPDGDTLTIESVTQPANGTVSIDGLTVVFTPGSDFAGTTTFTYTVCDPIGACDTATVTVGVSGLNDGPDARDDVASTDEDTGVTIAVLSNDDDIDGDTLTVTGASDPANGSVAVNLDGTITYTPDPDFSGADVFTYGISDGNGGSDTATVTVTVNEINDAPAAVDDVAVTDEDVAATIAVLSNDTDPDGDTLSVTAASDPANGSVAVNVDGTITYTPDSGFSGVDSFTYTIDDGRGGTSSATVSVTVNPVDNPPVALDDSASTTVNLAVSLDVLTNDSDPEGDTITITDITSQGTLGIATISGSSIVYTPDPGATGTDVFTYEITANGLTSTASVTVTIGAGLPPTAGDDSATVDEDDSVNIDVLFNDSDPDGGALTIAGATDPANGSVIVEADGTISYTPNANFNGTDSFTYTVCDAAEDCATASVSVTIAPVNDAPVGGDDLGSTDEDTRLAVPADGVLSNDTDPDGDGLTVVPATGSTTQGGAFSVDGDGSYTYDPPTGFSGTDSFTYTVCDDGTPSLCGGATVTIEVSAVNDPPVADDDAAETNEDSAVVVDVLTGDVDPDGDPLTVTAVSDPAGGSLTINPDGTVTYVPDTDFNGTDSFDYTVCDDGTPVECDTATVVVTVNPVNDPPVARDDADSTDEDSAGVTIAVLANDSDVDGDTLGVTGTSTPANGTTSVNADNTITYVPAAGFSGSDSFSYDVADGNGGVATAVVDITVNPTNDPPIALDDIGNTDEDTPVTIAVLNNDNDPDGDALTVDSVTQPAAGTVTTGGTDVTFTPAPDQTGPVTFTYRACDPDGACDTATVTIDIIPANDPPDVVDESVTVAAAESVAVSVLDNDSDPDGDSVALDSFSQPSNGSVTRAGDDLVYTPNPGFVGNDSFGYSVCDPSGACASGTVSVAVTAVNRPPAATDDTASTTLGTPVDIEVLANDIDLDGDPLIVTAVSDPANGTAVIDLNGSITYTPDPGFSGVDAFVYTVCDPDGSCDDATVQVGIDLEPPVAVDDAATTDEDVPVTIDVLANDSDGSTPTVTSVSTPANGTASIEADGTVTYTPNGDFFGSDSFTYTIADADGLRATATVTVTVLPINDPPVARADSASTVSGGTVAVDVLANDTDPDGDPLTITAATVDRGGSVTIVGSQIVFVADNTFTGIASVSYTMCDSASPPACDSAIATVTVDIAPGGGPSPVNRPPDYEAGFVPELTALIGSTLDDLPLVDPDGDNVTAVVLSGALPAGVTLLPDGRLTGVATEAGTFELELELCDDGAPVACVTRPLTIVIDAIVGITPSPEPETEEPAPVAPPGPVELDELPFTGIDGEVWVSVALTLIAFGAVLLRSARTEP